MENRLVIERAIRMLWVTWDSIRINVEKNPDGAILIGYSLESWTRVREIWDKIFCLHSGVISDRVIAFFESEAKRQSGKEARRWAIMSFRLKNA